MDIKTIIGLVMGVGALLGVTNIGTYQTQAAPAKAEATHNLVMYQSQTDDLVACHKQLRECYKELGSCGRANSGSWSPE